MKLSQVTRIVEYRRFIVIVIVITLLMTLQLFSSWLRQPLLASSEVCAADMAAGQRFSEPQVALAAPTDQFANNGTHTMAALPAYWFALSTNQHNAAIGASSPGQQHCLPR